MGLLRYGMKYEPIQKHLLPIKSLKEMYNRQKNRCHRVEHNCIRVRPVTAPFPAALEGSNNCHAASVFSLLLGVFQEIIATRGTGHTRTFRSAKMAVTTQAT